MRLWTIQPKCVIDILNEKGVFTCDELLSVNYEDFKDSYLWLVEQMDKKIKHIDNLKLPLWAWHTYNWKNSLEDFDFSDVKEDSVCIEFEINENEVVLSDFDAWHFVLNKWWFDDSYSEEEWISLNENFDKLPIEEQNKLKKESWIKIFDVSKYQNEWFTRGRYIQATFWELRKDMIRNIKYI